jgi:hypothetical protein
MIEWMPDPFPHAVADGLWSTGELRAAAEEFPPAGDPRWMSYNDPEERGKLAGDDRMWGPAVQHVMNRLMAPGTVRMLEKATGISGLVPDALGGGMHMTCEGGRLAMHADFNVHPVLRMQRRLNLLVFLNEEWSADWGGVLYLGARRETAVLPLFNRTAVFECSDESWHGHPEPVTAGHCRKSVACYYYTPLTEPVTEHSTVWQVS